LPSTLVAPEIPAALPASFYLLCVLYWISAVVGILSPPIPFHLSPGLLLALLWRMPASQRAMLVLLPIVFGGLLPEIIVENMRDTGSPWYWGLIVICALVLRRVCPARDPISTLSDLGRFAVTVTLGVLVSATLGALTASDGPFVLEPWLHRLAGQAIDLLLVTPIAVTLSTDPRGRREVPRSRIAIIEAGCILVLTIAASLVVFGGGWPLLAFLLIPPIMLATLRFGQIGAACATILMLAILAIKIHPNGLGLSGDPDTMLIRFDLATLFLTALVAATQLRQHRTLVAKLRESEARYRILAEGSGDAVLFVDEDWRCWDASASIEALLGYSPAVMERHPIGSCVHCDDLDAFRQAGATALVRQDRPARVQHRIRHSSGEWRWVETRLCAMRGTRHGNALACAIRDISEQRSRELALEQRATIDTLTGLLNRDSFIRSLDDARVTAEQEGQPFALVMFDVDHFKRINDTYGHPAGDRVLHAIGQAMSTVTRSTDAAGRIGGEEFGIVLRGAGIAAATDVCRRLRELIAVEHAFDDIGRPIVPTISIGIAPNYDGVPNEVLMASADRALYAAKHAGRDRAFVLIDDSLVQAL
jgi:diguanylate cyclase (GGDEF)-like protein/PAS domain S-box-containing protein